MKTLIMLFAFALTVITANAQKTDRQVIPAPVKEAMKKLYPAAQAVDWDKEDNTYEASFKQDARKHSVSFDAAGNVLETEVEIPASELPAAAREYIAQYYKGNTVKEADKITDKNGVVTYEADLHHKEVLFDASGKFIMERHEDHD